jgi:capsular polysaccharide biosynthesis protein
MLSSPDPERGWSREVRCVREALVLPASASVYADGALVETAALFRRERVFRGGPVEQLPAPARYLPGRHLWAGIALTHFGLFVTESLSRLWAVDGTVESVILTPRHFSRKSGTGLHGYQEGLVSLIGLGCPVSLVSDPTQVEELVVPGQGFGLGAISSGTPEFRAFAARIGAGITPAGDAKVYLSRSRMTRTRGSILGERILEENLAREGYRIFHPQEESLESQIAQYKAATHVLGPDGSAFHLAGLVARVGQTFGIIRRRNAPDADHMLAQMRGMGVQPHCFDCLRHNWVHPKRGRPGDESWGELDHELLAQRLTEEGFVADTTGWQVPQAADLEAELDLLAGVHGVPMKRL